MDWCQNDKRLKRIGNTQTFRLNPLSFPLLWRISIPIATSPCSTDHSFAASSTWRSSSGPSSLSPSPSSTSSTEGISWRPRFIIPSKWTLSFVQSTGPYSFSGNNDIKLGHSHLTSSSCWLLRASAPRSHCFCSTSLKQVYLHIRPTSFSTMTGVQLTLPLSSCRHVSTSWRCTPTSLSTGNPQLMQGPQGRLRGCPEKQSSCELWLPQQRDPFRFRPLHAHSLARLRQISSKSIDQLRLLGKKGILYSCAPVSRLPDQFGVHTPLDPQSRINIHSLADSETSTALHNFLAANLRDRFR